jgi:anti-sigma regulatory factor (Ser/Thr protein kinase)
MSSVLLTFQAAAEHVRTARLVAVSVARRCGLDEATVEDVRLAVGETCARAVSRCLLAGCPSAITVQVDDGGERFMVSVTDAAGEVDLPDESVALALVRSLADAVDFGAVPPPACGRVRLCWNRLQASPPGR